MNKREKVRFVRELTKAVLKDVMASVDRAPDTWDGFELRMFLRDSFADAAIEPLGSPLAWKRRKRDYKNTVLVNNL